MKNLLMLLLLPAIAMAQKDVANKVLESKIENVTVYENGAQVTRTAKTTLAAGRTQLVFRGVSGQIDPQSIQAQGSGSFTILSVVNQSGFLSEKTKTDERSQLEAQKSDLEEKIVYQKALLNVYDQEEIMLTKNQEIGGRTVVLRAAELKESVDFQRARLNEIVLKRLEINKTIKKLEADIFRINVRVNLAEPLQSTTTSEIVLTVSAKEPIAQTLLTVSYFVQNAGWKPSYDLRVSDIAHDLEMGYKANVFQYSGENWENVTLSLSTANPRKNGYAPRLQTWYWGVANNYDSYYNGVTIVPDGSPEIVGTVRSMTDKMPLPNVSVLLKGTSLITTTDANGNYKLNIPPDRQQSFKTLIFSFVGMISEERNVTSNVVNLDMQEDMVALQEVTVTGNAALQKRAMAGNISIRGKAMQPLDIEERESPISQSFDIKIPYSIPSDGKVYTVEIKNQEIPVYYEYYCLPKIDLDAFLNAKIVNWEQYNLLPGDVNLFFEGVFVGKSTLKLPNSDTLTISLGRDKAVKITRTKAADFTKKQLLGNYKTENRRYEISVRNTKKQAIQLLVEDQFPLSRTKEVEIENKTAADAQINPETGLVSWRLRLEPAQEKKLNFGYSVKFPKSGVVSSE